MPTESLREGVAYYSLNKYHVVVASHVYTVYKENVEERMPKEKGPSIELHKHSQPPSRTAQ